MNDIRKVLSYNDVLLVPRYSDLSHLSDANISMMYNGVTASAPLINAPMDTVSTPKMLTYLKSKNIPITVHRWFKSVEEQVETFKDVIDWSLCFIAVGIVEKWKNWIDFLNKYRKENNLNFGILIDVANGDTKSCINTIKYIRETFDNNVNIMAGNIATRSGYSRLRDAGANFIRVGIGGGCFVPEMLVCTNHGLKPISEIKIGDLVFTHTGELKEVISTISYYSEEEIYQINDIKCTKNHEFYVIDKKYKDIVTEENIHQYAKWVKAEDLSDSYLLIELE